MLTTWTSQGNRKSNNLHTPYKNVIVLFIINKSLVLSSWGFPAWSYTQSYFYEYYNIPVALIEIPDWHPYFPEDGKNRSSQMYFLVLGIHGDYISQPPLHLGLGQDASETWMDIRYSFSSLGSSDLQGVISSLFLFRKRRQNWSRFTVW